MLEDLSVRDFALIDSVSLEFEKGFTIFSGETGAGKSILIGSLSFLLGGKSSIDSIRSGSEEARVSGTVYISDTSKEARLWLTDKGISLENDRVLLRRTVRKTGKSSAWIQDTPVTRQELSDFTSFLVDIHGQHDHQSLLRVDQHRRYLDSYAGIEDDVSRFTALYSDLSSKRKIRNDLSVSEKERADKIELLSFSIDEIDEAKLSETEELELEVEEQRLRQYEKLYSLIDQASSFLSKDDGVVPFLKKTRNLLDSALSIDSSLSQLDTRLETVFFELDDLAESVRHYQDSLVFDPTRLSFVEERLSVLYRLKKKYGSTITEILSYAEESRLELQRLSSSEEDRLGLDSQIEHVEKELYKLGSTLSQIRKNSSVTLQEKVEAILRVLGMPGTRFKVSIKPREGTDTMQRSGPWGFDEIEFMISPNPGEPLRPLAKIASGGELSRVMLALKTVLADVDEADTLIFDEIDTGIGGEVALAVGGHLRDLSKRKQILCITHLASIAVRADNQIKIEKMATGDNTVTRAYPVLGEQRVEEVARMLAGDGFSVASMQHASELLARYSG